MSGQISTIIVIIGTIAACAAPMDVQAGKDLKTPQDYCAARAEAECNGIVVQKCGVKDQTSCESARSNRCVAEMPQGTTYVPEAVDACIAATKGAYADATLTGMELQAIADACSKVFSGPGAVRAPCTVDADCSSKDNLRCVIRTGEMAGKCLTPRVVQPGDSCAGESDVCTTEFYCDMKSSMCLARVGVGEDCYMKECLPDLKCITGLFGGGCKPLLMAGEPCTMDTECTSHICNKAKGSSDGTCTDQIVLSPIAAACAPFQ
jgi:hypothetical protein